MGWRAQDTAVDARAERLREAVRSRGEDAAAEQISAATAFEVRRAVAPALRRGRLFVIGDAAHEVSPIGGQGMNLGLLDAATLAPLLASWVRTGTAPDLDLAQWERRRVASARTSAALATLNTALGRPLPPAANAVRSAGLRLALLPPGAQFLAHAYAMGLDADARTQAASTRSARGESPAGGDELSGEQQRRQHRKPEEHAGGGPHEREDRRRHRERDHRGEEDPRQQ